jgi:MOSC domain-containing protein YiiM
MGDGGFVEEFRNAQRLGFYVRVLAPGDVAAGDAVERVHRDPRGVTIAELGRLRARGRDDLDALRAALAAADVLHPGWRAWMEGRVAELTRPR